MDKTINPASTQATILMKSFLFLSLYPLINKFTSVSYNN